MKKLLLINFAFLLAGCSHYVTLHKQELIAQNFEKLHLRGGLYIPNSITQDSIIDIDFGDEWNWTLLQHAKVGNEIANAIRFSVESSVEYLTLFDSLPPSEKLSDSLDFIILPQILSRGATLWLSSSNKYLAATFRFKVKLDIADQNRYIVDSIIFNTIGVSGIDFHGRKKDTTQILDSIIANAADSALQNLRSQITCYLLSNNFIKKLSGSQFISTLQVQTFPRYYGTGEAKLELDTISYELEPLANSRRWSIWDDIHCMSFEPERSLISVSADLLLYSHLSFRFGIGILNYYYHGLDSFTFVNNQFQQQSNDISKFDWILLTRVSYLFFGPRNFLEVGLGLNTELGKWFTGKITVPDQQRFQPLGIIGYRHQSIWFGSTFGASYMPYLDAQGLKHGFAINVGFGL
jgi:hypothetical protein